MAALRAEEGAAARALEFTILAAARTSETLGAHWPEMDLTNAVWSVPAARMKLRREHRVPLSGAALLLLRRMAEVRAEPDEYVFPGVRKGKPLSNMAMAMLLRRMGRGDLTVHGFRSTFRDWTAETTAYPREVAEMALAHAQGGETERAYWRGDLFEKRRRLMEDWAEFCNRTTAEENVVPLRGAAPGTVAS